MNEVERAQFHNFYSIFIPLFFDQIFRLLFSTRWNTQKLWILKCFMEPIRIGDACPLSTVQFSAYADAREIKIGTSLSCSNVTCAPKVKKLSTSISPTCGATSYELPARRSLFSENEEFIFFCEFRRIAFCSRRYFFFFLFLVRIRNIFIDFNWFRSILVAFSYFSCMPSWTWTYFFLFLFNFIFVHRCKLFFVNCRLHLTKC